MLEGNIPIFLLVSLFPFFFGAFWVCVVKLISLFGWSKFVDDRMMQSEPPAQAQHYAMQSMTIGSSFMPSNYSNCVSGWVHQTGVYLRPMWLFRIGHPLILLRWEEIARITESNVIFRKCAAITFRRDLPKLRLFGALGKAVLARWQEQNGNNRRKVEGRYS